VCGGLQEHLTDELVAMAASLKTNTKAFESKLKERGALMDDTDFAIDKSLDHARKSVARSKTIYQR
jgi:hypothetical protein